MTGWRPIEDAPKDGRLIWAYLFHSGIRAVHWEEDAWVEVLQPEEDWAPRWWLPYGALPEPPEASQ